MKVTLLTTTNSRLGGGVFYVVSNLGKSLLRIIPSISLMSYNDRYSNADVKEYGDLPLNIYKVIRLPLLQDLGFSINIHTILKEERPDIIHSQGIWMYNSYAALKHKKKYPETIR